MSDTHEFDRAVDRWLDDGTDATPPRVIDAVLLAARSTAQERDPGLPWRTAPMAALASAAAVVATIIIGVAAIAAFGPRFGIGSGLTPPEGPSADLGIFEPVAGWIVYGGGHIWGVDPEMPAVASVELSTEAGTPLAWSSDGTRLLIRRGDLGQERLFVLRSDGSEIRLTDRPMSIAAAAFSPDGSRVVFAAAESAHAEWAVYSTDDAGGTATVLTSQPQPDAAAVTFSPDATRLAYVLWGHGDGGHAVWIMDADGTDAHEIVANDIVMGPGHVRNRGALAWSPTGDRIALGLEGAIYTFATDGSDFKEVMRGDSPLWSPDGSQLVSRGPATWHPGTPSSTVESTAAPSASLRPTAPAVNAEINDLLDSFLQARIAGEGAEEYLSAPDDFIFGSVEDIPLLYATSSGDRYERAEFERVLGVNWPYGYAAFNVRLFAGDTVVEQLFFTPHDLELNPDPARTADAPLKLKYVLDGFGTDIAPTTENGQPVGVPYDAFDGEVTMRVAHPWVFQYDGAPIRLIPEGAPPTTDGGERNGWDHLVLMADPVRTGTDCPAGPGPADAAALAESIRSDPGLEATAPVAVGVEGAEGLMIDVVRAAGATSGVCGLSGDEELRVKGELDFAGNPVRLYLFDAPEGLSMRILAVAIVVPESRLERAVGAPVSVDFNTP